MPVKVPLAAIPTGWELHQAPCWARAGIRAEVQGQQFFYLGPSHTPRAQWPVTLTLPHLGAFRSVFIKNLINVQITKPFNTRRPGLGTGGRLSINSVLTFAVTSPGPAEAKAGVLCLL